MKPETGRKHKKTNKLGVKVCDFHCKGLKITFKFCHENRIFLTSFKSLYFRDYIMQCHDYVLYKGQLSQILGYLCRHVASLRLHKILCHCRQTFIPGNLVCSYAVLHTFLACTSHLSEIAAVTNSKKYMVCCHLTTKLSHH